MSFGVIVTKPGFDATTATVENQIFNSEANSLKIWKVGSFDISVSETKVGVPGTGQSDIAHNLSYAPFYLCYFKLKHASKVWFQDSYDTSMLFSNYIHGYAWSDTSKLYGKVYVSGDPLAAFTAVCYYIILIDPAYQA